jgi:hypothetical protein
LHCFASCALLLTRIAPHRRFAKGVLVTYIVFVALYSYVGLHTFQS